MVSYSGEALKLYNSLVGNIKPLFKNKYYSMGDYHVYINSWGYLHILRITKSRSEDGRKGFTILDYLLTTDGVLKISKEYDFFSTLEEARWEYYKIVTGQECTIIR